MTTFPNEEGYDELMPVRDIGFQSQHPTAAIFHGLAHVGYLPGERIPGLSKLTLGCAAAPPVRARGRVS